jgi:hypothetical protein
VVPAEPKEWTYDPFAGEIADGALWGRGAVDMLDMDAMTLAVVRDRMRTGRKPPRDVVLAFVADEEAGGVFGAQWLVEHQPALFEGCTEAISEVGGFSLSVNDDLRLYLIETAQKGMAWMRLTATGTAGHGSMVNSDNAVTQLCEAVARLGAYEFPIHVTRTVRSFLDEVGDAFGLELDPDDMAGTVAKLGPARPDRRRDAAGHRQPDDAGRRLQAQRHPRPGVGHGRRRFLPGFEQEWEREVDEALGPTSCGSTSTTTSRWRPSSRARWSTRWPARSRPRTRRPRGAVHAVRRHGRQELQPAGMRCFGFSPLRLPADLDFSGHVPRRGRAGAAGLAEVRRAGSRPVPGPVLTLEKLPNLGPASAGWLREVGIASYEDLSGWAASRPTSWSPSAGRGEPQPAVRAGGGACWTCGGTCSAGRCAPTCADGPGG